MSSSRGGSASASSSSRSASRSPGPQATSFSTPTTSSSSRTPSSSRAQSAAAYFSYPVTHVVSGLYRRLTEPSPGGPSPKQQQHDHLRHAATTTAAGGGGSPDVFTPKRTASPFQPPPLTPLTLKSGSGIQNQLLTRALAEEIRLLVPPRLQLVDTWRLAYSLDRDGSSLATLYENCRQYSQRSQRAGYVLVVRDASASSSSGSGGAIFGAYLTDAPHPAPHYYGTGECFLWRASVLPSTPLIPAGVDQKHLMTEEMLEQAGLPPPPSADTTKVGRSTTLRGEKRNKNVNNGDLLAPPGEAATNGAGVDRSGASTPDRIRFKAFPYSGVNDYMIFCETGFLSVGGGDGHYGLWLDDSVEKGVSEPCQTFGNEPLSDEGAKFDVLGVEVWYVGA
ncbi:hypothetical protein VTN00DRAFT_7111 [Thermoascus crustaceus]|uniref:uncharacterized protein n=1 Tax=Thermoascus crustaceus TaxID=5088 RepID=UPI003742C30B